MLFFCCTLLKRIVNTREVYSLVYSQSSYQETSMCVLVYSASNCPRYSCTVYVLGHLHFDYIFCCNAVLYTQLCVFVHPSGWRDASTSDWYDEHWRCRRMEVSLVDVFRTIRRWAMLMWCPGGDSQSFWSVSPWHEKWRSERKGWDEFCQ
jgi:hypothetical protein